LLNKQIDYWGYFVSEIREKPLSGKGGMAQQVKGNTHGLLGMLKKILHRSKGIIIDLFVDHAPWDKGQKVSHVIFGQKRFPINYIPKHHREYNFQETVWRIMRYEGTSRLGDRRFLSYTKLET